MALRGTKPVERTRLRALLSGKAGVGKSTAAIQMPKPYLIDCESGLEHYGESISSSGGVVFQTTDIEEVIREVKELMTIDHDYLTLVIDPLTMLWEQAVAEAAADPKIGDAYGRHTAAAGRQVSRLMALISQLDMNVIFTSHAKTEYKGGEAIGDTFDGYKKSDYIVDVHFHLERRTTGDRIAEVKKTRLEAFPDGAKFPWSYEKVAEMYGRDKLERKAATVSLASSGQVAVFTGLMSKLGEDEQKRLGVSKLLKQYPDLSDAPSEWITKGIEKIEKHLGSAAA